MRDNDRSDLDGGAQGKYLAGCQKRLQPGLKTQVGFKQEKSERIAMLAEGAGSMGKAWSWEIIVIVVITNADIY